MMVSMLPQLMSTEPSTLASSGGYHARTEWLGKWRARQGDALEGESKEPKGVVTGAHRRDIFLWSHFSDLSVTYSLRHRENTSSLIPLWSTVWATQINAVKDNQDPNTGWGVSAIFFAVGPNPAAYPAGTEVMQISTKLTAPPHPVRSQLHPEPRFPSHLMTIDTRTTYGFYDETGSETMHI
jgi:hypothetical protein